MATRVVTERVQPNADGLYECPECHDEHTEPLAAAICHDPQYDPDDARR